ncbi:MAG: DUF1989 domain-containing protein [Victivallales bacterium]|jgi:urea carboxylase-associated protein 2|nr:DUF1989 domain-containing protein [Victivallales bacterium]
MSTIAKASIITENVIAGGWNYSRIIRRGQTLRLTDLEGGGNVSAMFYNSHNFSERFNLGDTLKIQHICRLKENCCIYSDMGRILLSIPESSCLWHDMLCGCTHKSLIEKRFGVKDYQEAHNDFYRNSYDSLLIELGKHGMTRRDFTEVVNFFSKVVVDEKGAMTYIPGNSQAGDYIDLRAEMDTLIVLDTGMHPLSDATEYPRKPIKATLFCSAPSKIDDPCFTWCPENGRGFKTTELYNA